MKKILLAVFILLLIVLIFTSTELACGCNCNAAIFGFKSYITKQSYPSTEEKIVSGLPCFCTCQTKIRIPIETLILTFAVLFLFILKKK